MSRGSVRTGLLTATIWLAALALAPLSAQEFLRGDANGDGTVSFSDAITIGRFLFVGERPPSCLDSADVNDDGRINIADEVGVLVQFYHPSTPGVWEDHIAPPFPEPGVDTTPSELDCASYAVEPPAQTDDLVRLGDVAAAPGEAVEIPVFVSSSVAIDGVQIVVDYDPALFTPGLELEYDETFFGELGRLGFSALKTWPEQGAFAIAIIDDIASLGREIPAGEEVLVARIPGTVSANAPAGTTLSLDVRTTGLGPHGLTTELTHRGAARYVTTLPRVQGALLQIVGDLTFFRGDANGDEAINLADAQFTLNYLFTGGAAPPPCFDAADANDDGQLNVADPVTTLMYLFDDNVSSLPAPHPQRGVDETPDGLSCLGS